MYASPVEEKVIEDGTIEGANQYRNDTPGQEEADIDEGTSLQVKMALGDVGLKGTWKNGKVYVKKRDVKKAEKALKGNVIYKGKPPIVVGEEIEEHCGVCGEQGIEEVEIDEGKFKKGDIVIPNMGPHKGEKHKIIHDFGDGSYNITPQKHPRFIKYKQGAAKAKENQLKLVKEEVELDEKGTAYPATVDTLRKIVKDKQHQTVMFKSGQAIVDLFTASAMVQVYDALKKPDMKKTFEKMITDKAGFMKTQAFAMKMIGK
jgi:hypothetical protein